LSADGGRGRDGLQEVVGADLVAKQQRQPGQEALAVVRRHAVDAVGERQAASRRASSAGTATTASAVSAAPAAAVPPARMCPGRPARSSTGPRASSSPSGRTTNTSPGLAAHASATSPDSSSTTVTDAGEPASRHTSVSVASSGASAPARSSRSRAAASAAVGSRSTPKRPKPVPRISLSEVSFPSPSRTRRSSTGSPGRSPPRPGAAGTVTGERRAWVALLWRGLMRWLNSGRTVASARRASRVVRWPWLPGVMMSVDLPALATFCSQA
jgi:hypothetical protein